MALSFDPETGIETSNLGKNYLQYGFFPLVHGPLARKLFMAELWQVRIFLSSANIFRKKFLVASNFFHSLSSYTKPRKDEPLEKSAEFTNTERNSTIPSPLRIELAVSPVF